MPALTEKRTYIGSAIGRYAGKHFCPGVEVHPPVIQQFGAPRIGKLEDVLDAVSMATITSVTDINFTGVAAGEGRLARQLITFIVKAGRPASRSITIKGVDVWGQHIEETLSVTSGMAAPPFPGGPPGGPFPYSADGTVAPGYDLFPAANVTKKTFWLVHEVSWNSTLAGGVLYVGRNNTFGLKYPVIGNTDPSYWRTDKAAFVLHEGVFSPVAPTSAQAYKVTAAASLGMVVGGEIITGGDPRGTYTPYVALVDDPDPSLGGQVGFYLAYFPAQIQNVYSPYPHMFQEQGGDWDVFPARTTF